MTDEMGTLQKLKVYQLFIEYSFNGTEPEMEKRFLLKYFEDNNDEVNDLLTWRAEDKKYFTKKLKDILRMVEESEVMEQANCPLCGEAMEKHKFLKSQNYYWICRACKITVDILLSITEGR